jgi:two-component system, cell cycle response regulator DivK
VGQKILVVEDNELNLKLFCDLLRAHGYQAEPVRDGREALATARRFAPGLIVMDIQMPHISGLELIEQLKADAELRPIPIMAVTAYAARGDEERIRDAGAEGYVSKPISVLKFVEAVRALLEAAAARAADERPEEAEAPEEASTEQADGEETPVEAKPLPGEGRGPDGCGAEAAEPGEEGETAEVSDTELDAAAPETEEAAAPDGEAASEGDPPLDRHSPESGAPDERGDGGEEEGEPDSGLRRDDAGPKGDTP